MKDRKKKELEWNVYYEDFNGKKIVPHNVFNHRRFNEDVKKSFKKNKDDFEAFKKETKSNLRYYYWSKCEWEIILSAWINSGRVPEVKIDVYDQVMLNFDLFAKYVWDFYSSRRRKQTIKTNDKKQTTTENNEPIMYPFNVVAWHRYPDEKPIDNKPLLVTYDDGYIKIAFHDSEDDWCKWFETQEVLPIHDVIAWAELPEPYEDKKE